MTEYARGWLMVLVLVGVAGIGLALISGCVSKREPEPFDVIVPCDEGLICIPV